MRRLRRGAVLLAVVASMAACGAKEDPAKIDVGRPGNYTGSNEVVVRTSSSVPVAICPNGGVEIVQGLDANKDGQLTGAEILGTDYVCNGAPGAAGATGATGSAGAAGLDALVANGPAPSLAQCPNGGVTLQYGLDADRDNSLDPSEVTGSQAVCNGANGTGGTGGGTDGFNAAVSTSTSLPSGSCANGGISFSTGTDTNRNGVLDSAEVTATQYLCNGAPGAAGAAGANGLTALLNLSDEAPGGACGQAAGVRIQTGLDTDRDDTLASSEVLQTKYVCGGANGSGSTSFDLARFQEAVKTLESGDLLAAAQMLGAMKSAGTLNNDNAKTLYALTNVMMVMEEAQYSGVYKNFLDKVGAFAAGNSLFGPGEYHILENALARPMMGQVVVTSTREAAVAMLGKIENSLAELDAISGPVYMNLNFSVPQNYDEHTGGGGEMGAGIQPVNVDTTDVEIARGVLYFTASALNYLLAYDPVYSGSHAQLHEVSPYNLQDLILTPDYASRMTSSKSYLRKAIAQVHLAVNSLKAETGSQTYDFFQMAPEDVLGYLSIFSTLKELDRSLDAGGPAWISSVEDWHGVPGGMYQSSFTSIPCEIYTDGYWENMYGYPYWVYAPGWYRHTVAMKPYFTVFTEMNPSFAFSNPLDGTKIGQDFAGGLIKYRQWKETDIWGFTSERDAFWIDPASYLASEIRGALPGATLLDAPKMDNLGNPVPNTDVQTPWRRTPTGSDVTSWSMLGNLNDFSWTYDYDKGAYIDGGALEIRTYEASPTETRISVNVKKGGRAARSSEVVDFKMVDEYGSIIATDKPWESVMDYPVYNYFTGNPTLPNYPNDWVIGRYYMFYKKYSVAASLTDGAIYWAEVQTKDGRHLRKPFYYKTATPPPMIRSTDVTTNAWQPNGDLKLAWVAPASYTGNVTLQFLDGNGAQVLSLNFPASRNQVTIPAWVFQRVKDIQGLTPADVKVRFRTSYGAQGFTGQVPENALYPMNTQVSSYSSGIPVTIP